MPNHCTNLLSCTSNDLGKVLKPYMTEDGRNIDFNKILPMPEGIRKTHDRSTMQEIASIKYGTIEYEAREKEMKILHEANEKTYGVPSWYEWCVANWDTKWNAYSCWTLEEGSGLTLEEISDLGFQTAWSPPINVIRQLSKLTGESFRMSYYDEGWMFGGVFNVSTDGETDETYDKPEDCPEELWEELDVQYYLDCKEEEDA